MEYPERMQMAMMCHRMRWSYRQYMEQPIWFINLVAGLMSAEAKEQRKQK